MARLVAIGEQDDLEAQTDALRDLAEGLTPDEGYRLLGRLTAEGSPSLADELSRLVLRRFARVDRDALEQWAGDLPEHPLRTAAFTAAALHRSQEDTIAALEWARGLGTSPSEVVAVMQVAIEAAGVVPVAALDVAARLPASPERDQGLAHGVAQWAAIEPERAAEWASGLADESLRTLLLGRITVAMAGKDPLAAARWVAGALPPGLQQSTAAVAVAQRWAQQDTTAARAWVEQFPDVRLRADGLTAIQQATASAFPPEPSEGD